MISERTIGRISYYRRVLYGLHEAGERHIFSHQLAALVGNSAAQVRRDVMALGYSGSPNHGYDIEPLIESISAFLDAPGGQGAVLVGMGNLGRAILAYFSGSPPKLWIEAAFDKNPAKAGKTIHGYRCYPIADLAPFVRDNRIPIGIITVPPKQAQAVANALCDAGVHSLLNFSPTRLSTPDNVHVEDIDMFMAWERAAYFAHQLRHGKGAAAPAGGD